MRHRRGSCRALAFSEEDEVGFEVFLFIGRHFSVLKAERVVSEGRLLNCLEVEMEGGGPWKVEGSDKFCLFPAMVQAN